MNEESESEQKTSEEEQSEFGKGLSYCLGLFLAHAERYGKHDREMIGPEILGQYPTIFSAEMWFNGASDHLYELQIDSAPESLQFRIKEFQKKCLRWGHGFNPEFKATEEDKDWAIQEAKDLLRLIDESNNIPTEKGQWE